MNNIYNKITSTIKKHNMLQKGDRLLLAVSGGADSMLMLDYFVHNRDMLGIIIGVAHVEHGIRGQASLDDANFVKAYCKSRDIEYHELSIDAVNEAKECKKSVEEYSRERRYSFFSELPYDKIATAHNLNDNIETVLFRACRGTSVKGLCGIPVARDNIIRPLIDISSSDIRSFCESNNIEFRVDSTNLDSTYSRNKIRNDILPRLRDINSSYEDKLALAISDISELYLASKDICDEYYEVALVSNKLDKNYLIKLGAYYQKELIYRYFSDNGIELDRFHLEMIQSLIYKSSKYQISGDIFAISDGSYIRCARLNNSDKTYKLDCKTINIEKLNTTSVDFYLDCDKIKGELFFRSRAEHDKITCANRGCTKSLKKLFNELGIPVEDREAVPVICDDMGVIGVYPYCVDERVKVDSSTKAVITIKNSAEDD